MIRKKKTLRKKEVTKEQAGKPAEKPVEKQRLWNPAARTMSDIKKMKLLAPKDAPSHFPKFDSKMLPGTYFRMDGKMVDSLVTVFPDGVHCSWSTCGRCLGTIDSCNCKAGMVHTQGIEWIYIRTLLWKEKVFDSSDRVTADHHEVTSRGLYWYAPKASRVGNHPVALGGRKPMVSSPVAVGSATGKKTLRKKGQPLPAEARQVVQKPSTGTGAPRTAAKPAERRTAAQVPAPVSLAELNRDAASRSDELEAAFSSATSSAGSKKKPLRKRAGQNNNNMSKKPLRKKG